MTRRQTAVAGLFRTPFASAFGYLGLATGIRALLDPAYSPVGTLLGAWQTVWAVAYGLGGLLMLLGVMAWRPKIEAAGICLFMGGILVQAIAFAALPDFARAVGWPTILSLVVFAVFAGTRLRHIFRGESLMWVEVRPQ